MKRHRLAGIVVLLLLGIAVLVVWRWSPRVRYNGKTIPALCKQLDSMDQSKRDEATRGLQSLGARAVPDLVRMLQYRDPFIRRQALKLAPSLPGGLRWTLVRWVGMPMETVYRCQAGRGLAVVGPDAAKAVPSLERALNGPDIEVRWQAGAALGKIGKAAIPVLAATVGNPTARGREPASGALVAVGPDLELLPLVVGSLRDPSEYVRSSAGSALTAFGTNAWPYVTNLLFDTNPVLQAAAAKAVALAHPSRRSIMARLLELARSPEPPVRRHAIEALGEYHLTDPGLISLYVSALDDPSDDIRLAALQALFGAGGGACPAVPELKSRMNQFPPACREVARKVIENCRAPKN